MMQTLVDRFAEALKVIDSSRERHKHFQPGVGPYGEPQVIRKALEHLKKKYPEEFGSARTKREPDVLIPGKWALEFKIVRPFGDNGKLAEHWSENILHPYEGNISALGDCLKLNHYKSQERKGVVVFVYEHTPPVIDLRVLVNCFELLARDVLRIKLTPRAEALEMDLVHPVHQQVTVYGWEIMG